MQRDVHEEAIRFENVTKEYSEGPAVVDLNLTVRSGELVVLLGPSGSGKTTTLRMINRLIIPTAGRVLVNGEDAATQDPQLLRRGIGYVIQATGLFPHLTVGQNIEVVPRLLGWSKARRQERARELVELIGLEPSSYLNRYPGDLSGGEQQRVGVARALAADPPLLLMDEPFGAVDPLTRARLQDEFRELQRRLGKTVVFVTHDLDEAVKIADRICLMRAGRVEQYATPSELLGAPASSFVADFVGPLRSLQRLGTKSVSDVMTPAKALNGTGLPAQPHVSATDDLRVALAALLESGADALRVQGVDGELAGTVTLEDVRAAGKRG